MAANAAIFLALGMVSFGGCLDSGKKEEIVPVEFLVVTEENAADVLAEAPNEAAEEPEPEPTPTPEPEPAPKAPEPDPIPPPKPEPKAPPAPPRKAEAPKAPEPPKKPRYVQAKDIKKGRRVGPVIEGPKDRARAATDRKLSEAEIRRLLAAGARPGARNQVPPNEASRCYGVIARAFREACSDTLEGSPTGRDPVLTVTFGRHGAVERIALKRTCGDAAFDRQVLAACRKVRRVEGLSAGFLDRYATVDIEVNVR